jgi:hypothetical protein
LHDETRCRELAYGSKKRGARDVSGVWWFEGVARGRRGGVKGEKGEKERKAREGGNRIRSV